MSKRGIRIEANAGEAARLGAELRDARQALGLSLEDMSAALRIRRVYLAALEDGRARELPAPAYAVGFVRTYARALGLDEDEMVRRFRETCGPVVQKKTDLVFPEPVPERGVPAGAVMLLGAVLAVGAYVGWYNWSGSGSRTVDAVPPPPPAIERAAREATQPDPLPAPSPSATTAAAAPAPPRPPVVAPPAPVAPVVAVTPPAPAAPPPPANRIELRAKGDVWVQVRERNVNPSLVDRTFRAGDTFAVPTDRQNLLLSLGNYNNIEILVDGVPTAGFAPGGQVRRNIPLDAEKLKTTKVPAPAPPRPRPVEAAAPAPASPPQ